MQFKSFVLKIASYATRNLHATSVNLDTIGMNKLYYARKSVLLRVANHVRILIVMFARMECSLVLMGVV